MACTLSGSIAMVFVFACQSFIPSFVGSPSLLVISPFPRCFSQCKGGFPLRGMEGKRKTVYGTSMRRRYFDIQSIDLSTNHVRGIAS